MPRLAGLNMRKNAYDVDERCDPELPSPVFDGTDDDLFPAITDSWAERLSFSVHTRVINRTQPPDLTGIHSQCEQAYSKAVWSIPSTTLEEQCLAAIRRLDKTTNPGYPLCRQYTSNGLLLDAVGESGLITMVMQRIQEYLNSGPTAADPIRVFIKRELHSRKKFQAGRMRLIWSISVVDALVDHILFDPSLQAEVTNHREIPAQPGLSFANGGMIGLYRRLAACTGQFAAADKSNWDWTVAGWEYDFDNQARRRLCLNWPTVENDFEKLWNMRYIALSQCRMMFSNGESYAQNFRGIMKSGSVLTISMNSRLQFMLKLLYLKSVGVLYEPAKHLLVAMGDDTIESVTGVDLEDYQRYVNSLGHILKRFEKRPTPIGLDFCSQEYRADPKYGIVIVSNAWKKCLTNLWIGDPRDFQYLPQTLRSYCEMFVFDEDKYKMLHKLLVRIAPDQARSREYFMYHVTGNETFLAPPTQPRIQTVITALPGHPFAGDVFVVPEEKKIPVQLTRDELISRATDQKLPAKARANARKNLKKRFSIVLGTAEIPAQKKLEEASKQTRTHSESSQASVLRQPQFRPPLVHRSVPLSITESKQPATSLPALVRAPVLTLTQKGSL